MSDAASTIYVVDDNDAVRTALRRYLELEGFAVRVFASGNDFLDQEPPPAGCLVLDFDLPELNGLEVMRQAQSRGWTLPVIMITGNLHAHMREEALRTGARAFLEKPIDAVVLIATIEKAFAP